MRVAINMKRIFLYVLCLSLLSLNQIAAKKWSTYDDLGPGNVENGDTFLILDQTVPKMQKQYKWQDLITDLEANMNQLTGGTIVFTDTVAGVTLQILDNRVDTAGVTAIKSNALTDYYYSVLDLSVDEDGEEDVVYIRLNGQGETVDFPYRPIGTVDFKDGFPITGATPYISLVDTTASATDSQIYQDNDLLTVRGQNGTYNEYLTIDLEGSDLITFGSTSGAAFAFTPGDLDAATGNEYGVSFNVTANKATSGDVSVLYANLTNTATPDEIYLLNLAVNAVTRFGIKWDDVNNEVQMPIQALATSVKLIDAFDSTKTLTWDLSALDAGDDIEIGIPDFGGDLSLTMAFSNQSNAWAASQAFGNYITAGGMNLDNTPTDNGDYGYASNVFAWKANDEILTVTFASDLITFNSTTSATFEFTPAVSFGSGITISGDIFAADGNTDLIIQSDDGSSNAIKLQVRDINGSSWVDIVNAISGDDPILRFTAPGGIEIADDNFIEFLEADSDPNDATILLYGDNGIFKIVTQAGVNYGDYLQFDLDDSASSVLINSGGKTAIDFSSLNMITTGYIDGETRVTVKTTSTSPVTVTGSARAYFNNHASVVQYNLPADASGKAFCFRSMVDYTITVAPNGADYIIVGDDNSASVGEAWKSSGAKGEFLCLVGMTDTYWVSFGYSGSWAEATP